MQDGMRGLSTALATLVALVHFTGAAPARPFTDPRAERSDAIDQAAAQEPRDPACHARTLVSAGGAFPRNPHTLAVRWIGFSNFERRLHGMDESYTTWTEPKKRSVEELDALWLKTAQELYGKEGEIFTYENSEHLWAYIPHFHSPFYVYGYAFGELLTQSLFAQRQRLGAKFEPLYLDLLRSGATKDVVELLAPFGLDARNEAFWKDGITVSLGALIEEAEQLTRAMGLV